MRVLVVPASAGFVEHPDKLRINETVTSIRRYSGNAARRSGASVPLALTPVEDRRYVCVDSCSFAGISLAFGCFAFGVSLLDRMDLYFASGNAHKAAELQSLADASHVAVRIISARAVGGMPHVVEDAGTFVGNARKKALALRTKLAPDAWALADDSGLCVDSLGGGPGVESAYYAGPQGDGAANLAKLVAVMRDIPAEQRLAHFRCVLLLIGPHDEEHVFEGRCNGQLLFSPRGGAGFGYDPLFVPDGYDQSFAELGDDVKNQLSHRARAWAKLAEWVRGRTLPVP